MKKIFLTAIMLILVIGVAGAVENSPIWGDISQGWIWADPPFSAFISNPPPQLNPLSVMPGEKVEFNSTIGGGHPPYTIYWHFCDNINECEPINSTVEDPGNITFKTGGPHIVTLMVKDSADTTINDDFTISMYMVEITSPDPYTGWGVGDEIFFEGIARNAETTTTFDYQWDFDDGETYEHIGIGWNESVNTTHVFDNPGVYNVSLYSIDSMGYNDTASIDIYLVSQLATIFNCTVKSSGSSCNEGEMELMRFARLENTHARAFDDPDKYLYSYPLCCNATSLIPIGNNDSSGSSMFAALSSDSDSLIGGSHFSDNYTTYYHLTSDVGVGTECSAVEGKCSDLPGNKDCVFEFLSLPEETPGGTHFANCTEPWESNFYPYQMCCEVAEDCTNNIDDNLNTWTDCADNDVCTAPGGEMPCGISSVPLYDECAWYENYTWQYGYNFENFTNVTLVNIQFLGETICYQDVYDEPYEDCLVCLNAEGDDLEYSELNLGDCPTTGSPSIDDLSLPEEVLAMDPPYYPPELYGSCRLYYCSLGKDTEDPLPPFVENMTSNGNETRHCCPAKTYWDPSTNKCEDFSECYNPSNPAAFCDYNYITEFETWLGDYNYTPATLDCIDETFVNSPDSLLACCPVWQFNNLEYEYLDVKYYNYQPGAP